MVHLPSMVLVVAVAFVVFAASVPVESCSVVVEGPVSATTGFPLGHFFSHLGRQCGSFSSGSSPSDFQARALLAVEDEDAVLLPAVEVDVALVAEYHIVAALSSPDPEAVVVVLFLCVAKTALLLTALDHLVYVVLLLVVVLVVHGRGDVVRQGVDVLLDVLVFYLGGLTLVAFLSE